MEMPKVISLFRQEQFEDRFPEIPILGKPTNLFVECISYDVLIPVSGVPVRFLNIFEEVVLRMVRLSIASIDELADILCLDKDLVWFILNCLQEKGLLDEKFCLMNEGKRLLIQNDEQKIQTEQIQGKVFVLKKTGQILPYIHIGEFQSEKVDERNATTLVLGYGTAGNSRTVKGVLVRNTDYESATSSRLSTQQLREAVFRFNRLMILQNRQKIDFCQNYAIDSSKNEPVYFHLQAVVQDGNSDEIMFSDGFVPNVDGMQEYIKDYPNVIDEIQKRAAQMTLSSDGEETQSAPVRKKYWEIVRNYNKVKQALSDKAREDTTQDERKEMDKNSRQIAIDCYHILETALLYYLKAHPVSETMLGVLQQQTATQNGQTVLKIAESLRVRHTKEAGGIFFHMDGKRITSLFENGVAHMYICLPLAIVEAKESPDSRVRLLIQKHSGFLRFLHRLNGVTAEFRHSADATANSLNMTDEYIVGETAGIACTLLPELQFDDGNKSRFRTEDVSQARLLAQASLAKAFGPIRFQMMSDGMKNEWMRISPDKTGRSLPEMNEYAQILYRILQTSLANVNQKCPNRQTLSKEKAILQLKELYGKPLPKSLTSVTESFYQKAVHGQNSSLGAEALVYAANHNGMEELIQAGFVQTIDKVLQLRGHGGQRAALTENEHTMGELRDKTIELIKMIGG